MLQDRRRQDQELLIELERNSMALLANINRDPKKSAPYTGKDFYTLSYDEVVEESKMTGEQMYDLLSERFKNKPIRKRG